MAKGMIGKGTTLTIGSLIANIISAGFVEGEVGKEDVTTLDTVGNTEEILPTMVAPGATEFTALYSAAVFAAVDALVAAASQEITLTLPDGATQVCDGYVASRPSGPIEVKSKMVFKFRVQWTGEAVFTE